MSDRMDEAKGTLKEAAGKVLGNERLEAEGKADRTTARATRKTKGAANKAAGGAKAVVGDVLGDQRLQAEGDAQRARGKAQSAG